MNEPRTMVRRPNAPLPLVRATLLFAAVLYAIIGTVVFVDTPETLVAVVRYSLYAVAVGVVLAAVALARKAAALRDRPSEAAALAIVVWGLAEGVAILGLVLDALGAPQIEAIPLYALGIGLLLWWTPKRVLPPPRRGH